MSILAETPIRGRTVELSLLKTALRSLMSGRGRVVLVTGEAGIGKTRLLQEAANQAHLIGARVSWTRCHEDAGGRPFGTWQAVLASLSAAQPSTPPSKPQGLPTSMAAVDDPILAREERLDRTVRQLVEKLRSQPTVVILDDLQRSDYASVALLGTLAVQCSESNLMVIGAYRDTPSGGPQSDTEVSLSRLTTKVDRIRLSGLALTDLALMLQPVIATPELERVLPSIHSLTEGHPLLALEVSRLLATQVATLAELGARLKVPDAIRHVVHGRLHDLSKEERTTLEAAAVIGRSFDLGVLVRTMDAVSREQVMAAIASGLKSGLLEEGNGVQQLSFRHAITRDSLYDELSVDLR